MSLSTFCHARALRLGACLHLLCSMALTYCYVARLCIVGCCVLTPCTA